MQFIDLGLQYESYKQDIDSAIQAVIDRGDFINGHDVRELEAEIATYVGSPYALGCNSGTDALLLSLMAMDLQPGDEVITTTFTFVATAETIDQCGLKPVFVDIDPVTYNMDLDQLESAITDRTRAIMPVYLFGQMTDMEKLTAIADKHNLALIEDVAQAFGARCDLGVAGSIGRFGCHSFFPTKNLAGYGDGGMITMQDEADYDMIKRLRNHGQKVKYVHEMLGMSSRLDTMQAAIIRVKLKNIATDNAQRKQHFNYYTEQLQDIAGITCPQHVYGEAVPNMYCLRTSHRDKLQDYLNQHDIPTMVYYPVPLHLQPYFVNKYGYTAGMFPVAEAISQEILALPFASYIAPGNQDTVIQHIHSYFA